MMPKYKDVNRDKAMTAAHPSCRSAAKSLLDPSDGSKITEGDELEAYHNNIPVCAQKVRVVPRKKTSLDQPPSEVSCARAAHARVSSDEPARVVPVLVHDGNSRRVERHLRLSRPIFPDPPLMPKKPVERATMRSCAKLPDDILHMACATVSFAVSFAPLKKRLATARGALMKMPDPRGAIANAP